MLSGESSYCVQYGQVCGAAALGRPGNPCFTQFTQVEKRDGVRKCLAYYAVPVSEMITKVTSNSSILATAFCLNTSFLRHQETQTNANPG
eukprot:g21887.t1